MSRQTRSTRRCDKVLCRGIKKMKKPTIMEELKKRELEFKGSSDELSARLLDAVKLEKDAADEERREAAMGEEEKLAREVAEQEAVEERERLEAEEGQSGTSIFPYCILGCEEITDVGTFSFR